ncbi:MAG: PQQ-binding-like beta-propeller repeat protein, partial [Desulfobacteraceae bacterium]|nr:PQQ-binding-like beta-propeller repeat protein [Desulfobacteraceae bacterium]
MPIILALSKLHGRIKRLLHRLSWAVFLFTLGICPLCVWSQVIDFDGMAPALGLHSSRTQEGFVGHLGTYEDVHRFTCGTDGAVVVYRSTDPTALNASRLIDGLHLWTFEAEGEINCKPLVAKGVVFFGSDGGYFYALDERTGQRLWKFDGRREESVVEKVVKETKKEKKKGGLFGKLKRVKDAVEKVQEVTKTEYKPNNLRTRPALKDDVIAVYVPAKKIVGLNYLTGEVIWEFELYEGKVP